MTYRITLKSNPRIAFLILLSLALPALGIVSLFFIRLWGIIIIAFGGYFAYQILKFVNAQITSRIVTHDEGITFYLPFDETERLTWNDLQVVGKYRSADEKEKPHLFIYNEEKDRLISIPGEYENLADLEKELRSRYPEFREMTLPAGESIEETLQKEFAPAESVTDAVAEDEGTGD